VCGRLGGLINALVPGASGPGSSPSQGHGRCVLGQGTQLSQCLSPPRSMSGCFLRSVFPGTVLLGGSLTNFGRLASRPVGVEILLTASCYRNQDKIFWQLIEPSAPRLQFHTVLYVTSLDDM